MPVVEPLSLDNEELRVVRECAATLPPALRRGFLEDFAREMGQHAEHGAGLVSRVARAVVRRHQAYSGRAPSSQAHSGQTQFGQERSGQERSGGSASASAQSRLSARSSAEALFRHPVRQPAS
jgi:hypothetical protein